MIGNGSAVPNDANTQRITDVDRPGTLVPHYPGKAVVPMELRLTRQHIAITNIDIEYQFLKFIGGVPGTGPSWGPLSEKPGYFFLNVTKLQPAPPPPKDEKEK